MRNQRLYIQTCSSFLENYITILVAMLDFLDQVVARVPNFAGMKFVTFLLADLGRCMRKYGDRVEISYGKEEV